MAEHLWDSEHPYRCEDSNFRGPASECKQHFETWELFIEDGWGHSDADLNLLFRWDWKQHTRDDGEARNPARPDILYLFWMLQRKGDFRIVTVNVSHRDEDDVRGWLQDRLNHLVRLWAPLGVKP